MVITDNLIDHVGQQQYISKISSHLGSANAHDEGRLTYMLINWTA